MEVSCQFHILVPLVTFGYEAGWGLELVRTLGMGDKSNSVVIQSVAKSVYWLSSPGMHLLNVGVCVCVYTHYHYLICLQLVVTSVGSCLLQHHSHLLVLYFSSLRLWGLCGLFAVNVWISLVCISSWFKQQFCWDSIVSMEIGLLICSQYIDSVGEVYFIQQMCWDLRV